jgi:hypothetical protein
MFGGASSDVLSIVQNPEQSEQLRELLSIVAAIENEQRQETRQLCEAAGVDPDELGVEEPPDLSDRVDELCSGVGSRISGDPWDVWVDHVVPDDVVDEIDREAAAAWADLDPEEWTDEMRSVIDHWRDSDTDTTEYSDADLLHAHVVRETGLAPHEFVEWVLGYSAGRCHHEVFAARLKAHTRAIEAAREEVEN